MVGQGMVTFNAKYYSGVAPEDQLEHFLKRALKYSPKDFFIADFLMRPNDLFYDTYQESKRCRLAMFCSDVKNNRPISEETLEWLADAGKEYLEGKSALSFALGVDDPEKRGRGKNWKAFMAGLRMFALVHCENEKYEVALLQVMEQSKVPERSIKRAYAEWREHSKHPRWCQKDE